MSFLSLLKHILLLPLHLSRFILSLAGLAAYPRQIVKITPSNPAILISRRERDDSSDDAVDGPEDGDKAQTIAQWVFDNVSCLRGTFTPSWWLPNGHLQTVYSVLGDFTKVDQVEYARTYLRVPDGGTLALDFTPPCHASLPESTPTVVICHGLTGGSHESYVRNVLAWVVRRKDEGGMGARGVVVNVGLNITFMTPRSSFYPICAGCPVTSPQLYSAGTTIDLATSLHFLRNRFPSSPLHGIGFSLGASVLARYLGESSHSSLLTSGIVLGCPWDLPAMSLKLEGNFFIRSIYSEAMASNLLNVFFGHYDRNPAIWDDNGLPGKDELARLKRYRARPRGVRLKDVDDHMVAKLGGPRREGMWPFKDADAYHAWASPKRMIARVKRPVLSISAFDDPICDGKSIPVAEISSSTHVYGAVTGSGGHLGWFDGTPSAKTRWIAKPIREFLTAAARDLAVEGGEVDVVAGGMRRPVLRKKGLDKGLDTEGDEMADVKVAEGETVGGWEWVVQPAHDCGQPLGWRVLREGQIVEGAEGSGVLQGL